MAARLVGLVMSDLTRDSWPRCLIHVMSCSPKAHVATPDNRRHRLSLSKQYLSLVGKPPTSAVSVTVLPASFDQFWLQLTTH